MHIMVYLSDFIAPQPIAEVLGDITHVSAVMNQQHNITGALFYNNGQFLQILEGDKVALKQLMQNIERDSRHTNVNVIIDETIHHRSFNTWSLKAFDISDGKVIDSKALLEFKQQFDSVCSLDAELFVDLLSDLIAADKLTTPR